MARLHNKTGNTEDDRTIFFGDGSQTSLQMLKQTKKMCWEAGVKDWGRTQNENE